MKVDVIVFLCVGDVCLQVNSTEYWEEVRLMCVCVRWVGMLGWVVVGAMMVVVGVYPVSEYK